MKSNGSYSFYLISLLFSNAVVFLSITYMFVLYCFMLFVIIDIFSFMVNFQLTYTWSNKTMRYLAWNEKKHWLLATKPVLPLGMTVDASS